jgi:hypothetical protein
VAERQGHPEIAAVLKGAPQSDAPDRSAAERLPSASHQFLPWTDDETRSLLSTGGALLGQKNPETGETYSLAQVCAALTLRPELSHRSAKGIMHKWNKLMNPKIDVKSTVSTACNHPSAAAPLSAATTRIQHRHISSGERSERGISAGARDTSDESSLSLQCSVTDKSEPSKFQHIGSRARVDDEDIERTDFKSSPAGVSSPPASVVTVRPSINAAGAPAAPVTPSALGKRARPSIPAPPGSGPPAHGAAAFPDPGSDEEDADATLLAELAAKAAAVKARMERRRLLTSALSDARATLAAAASAVSVAKDAFELARQRLSDAERQHAEAVQRVEQAEAAAKAAKDEH